MSAEEYRALMQRYIDGINQYANTDWVDQVFTVDCVIHNPAVPFPIKGVDGMKEFVAVIYGAFPDFHVHQEDILCTEDRMAVRSTVSGTFNGSFAGIPPTGAHTTWEAIAIYDVVDGKIAELWEALDLLGAWQRLGVIPQLA